MLSEDGELKLIVIALVRMSMREAVARLIAHSENIDDDWPAASSRPVSPDGAYR